MLPYKSLHGHTLRHFTLHQYNSLLYQITFFFSCVETFTRVSERQERNDFNEHKMMMMTAKWDNKVCRNLDF